MAGSNPGNRSPLCKSPQLPSPRNDLKTVPTPVPPLSIIMDNALQICHEPPEAEAGAEARAEATEATTVATEATTVATVATTVAGGKALSDIKTRRRHKKGPRQLTESRIP